MKNGKRKLPGRAVRTVTAVLAVIFAAAVPASAATAAFRAGSDASETFYDLTSAVAHARNGETITVADDGKIGDENVTIDRDLILDLAGHRLEGDPEHPGRLTVHKKLTVRGPGMLSAAHIVVDDGGTLVIGDGAEIRATGFSGGPLNGFLATGSAGSSVVLKNGRITVPPEVSGDYSHTVINCDKGTCDLTGGGFLSVGFKLSDENVFESRLISAQERASLPALYGELSTPTGDDGRVIGIYETDGADPEKIQDIVDHVLKDGDCLSVDAGSIDLTTTYETGSFQIMAASGEKVTVDGRPVPVPRGYEAYSGLMVEPLYTYVAFDAGGGTGTMEGVQVTIGETYTLPECGFTPPDGKVFDKWNVNAPHHAGWVQAPGEDITVSTYTEVSPIWKDAPVSPTWIIIAAAAVLAVVVGVFLFRGKKKEK